MEKVQFETFDGPLDLLLNLLSKNEIDIYDIPIAKITDQYMAYLYKADELNIELASEFIVVASQLIEIKSRMMLPKEEPEEPEADPREELVRRLNEYRVFKQISEYIRRGESTYQELVVKDPEYFPQLNEETPVELSTQMLLNAIRSVFSRTRITPEEEFDYTIMREEVSVEEMMEDISGRLDREGKISFFSLFENHSSKYYVIAAFLAILEMVKDGTVLLYQETPYADIIIERA
ncbi:MAG: segregation/condensation protein A [Eubacteriaceae bacterium]|nr:segregation/condensation protein A [Eubacteriaceae bacterium]MCR4893320.1 segregation/condensation protein A [Eubacteriales bacterium]